MRAMITLFKDKTNQNDRLLQEILRRYTSIRARGRRSNRDKINDERLAIKQICLEPRILKKIRKFTEYRQIFKLRYENRRSLQRISQTLSLPLNKVTNGWRLLRKTKGNILTTIHDDITFTIHKKQKIREFLAKILTDDKINLLATRQIYREALSEANDNLWFSFNEFYLEFKRFGFRYNNIRYAPKLSREVRGQQLQNFLTVYLYFVIFEHRFEILFIDESSICPSNFKKRFWQVKGKSSVIRSSMKYEKITILGAMSRKRVEAIQFVHSNFNSHIFFSFCRKLIETVADKTDANRQLVFFMDNCPSHRSRQLLELCRSNNIIVMFNLPRRSELNPIEYLWEVVKRPFRSMTEYSR